MSIIQLEVEMQWVCMICGYVHDGDELPDMCPVCAAPKFKFAKFVKEDRESLLSEVNDDDDFEANLFGDIEE